jgi:hypothetical protein
MPLEDVLKPVERFNSEIGTDLALTKKNSSVGLLDGLKCDYLKTCDPAEWRFAQKHFPGGWTAWRMVQQDPDAMQVIGQWRAELWAKLRSDSLRRILEAANGETRDALGANKYIYETFDLEDQPKVGRPSKEKIQKEAERLVEDDRIRDEAYRRIFNAQEEEIKS